MSLSALQLDSSGEFDLLYNFFYVKDYTGQESYSSYALPITPLTFIPNLTDGIEDFISNKRIVWDFGDGTTTETITARHAYTTQVDIKLHAIYMMVTVQGIMILLVLK